MSEQVYLCSPGDLLASILSKGKSFQQLYLLSAASGAGKTTWCFEFVAQAREAGLKVAGLLSPAVFNGEEKIGIDMLDLSSQVRRSLASRSYQKDPHASLCGAWIFNQETLAWGNHCLQNLETADILVLDEIGPLEFIHAQGLTAGLQLLDSGSYSIALVTIRPSLLETVRQRWPHSQVIVVSKDNTTPGGEL
ncbi:MAG: nucleoside-triphosphatase [Anaerolineales bacterium]